jgi:hypothetical protein
MKRLLSRAALLSLLAHGLQADPSLGLREMALARVSRAPRAQRGRGVAQGARGPRTPRRRRRSRSCAAIGEWISDHRLPLRKELSANACAQRLRQADRGRTPRSWRRS